jgi:hypothetical protein
MTGPQLPSIVLTPDAGGKLGQGDPNVAVMGTGTSVPGGIECQFSYNELILNDTTVIDKYRVTTISGLDDPDVRDSREDNPAYEGETVYATLHGGRTIVLEGRVEAFSLHKLRDMQQALRTAFADLSEEKKLYFLTGNGATDHYIMCKKNQKLQWGEEQTKDNFFRTFQITLRASNPRFLRNRRKNALMAFDDGGITLINEGNFKAQPIIRLRGSLANIEFQNTSAIKSDGSYETFKLKSSVTIASGNYYEIDVANNTIRDKLGTNRFSSLDYASDWPTIYPGGNAIFIPSGKCTSSGSDGSIEFIYRDSWI